MATIQGLPAEMLQHVVFFLVPDDSYKCPHCDLSLLKPLREWRHTLKAFRKTCKLFAELEAPKQALFHTIHFHTAQKDLTRLEALSDSCTSLVKRTIFHDPILPGKFESKTKYQEQLQRQLAADHRVELQNTSFTKKQIDKCTKALWEPWGRHPPTEGEKGFMEYSRRLSEQDDSISKGDYVEGWCHILNRLQNLEEVVVRQWGCEIAAENSTVREDLFGHEWCYCDEAEYEDQQTDLEALHPEVLVHYNPVTKNQHHINGAICLAQMIRALSLSRRRIKALTVGPGIVFSNSFDWTQLKSWRLEQFILRQRLWDEDLRNLVQIDLGQNLDDNQ
ncbi:MAG: hypothetical protein M1831_003075 [Alyxoria varia]|nr:MAG: hypothetical protein M1831_003075 [Alyxoria varia]